MRFSLVRRSRRDENEGQYVDVLLSVWAYLDEESREALIRERPPSAPVLLAAYRRAAAQSAAEVRNPDRRTNTA